MFIKPMKAKKDNQVGVPQGGYIYETKWDGVRAIMVWDRRDGMTIYSKNGADISRKFPELIDRVNLNDTMTCNRATFDAELVCFKQGVPSFGAITSRFHLGDKHGWNAGVTVNPVCACLFDILSFEGENAMHQGLMRRKALLNSALIDEEPYLISQVYTDGQKLYDREEKRGAEGIIAKAKDSIYQPGRRLRDWLKVKIMYEEEVIIYGFTKGKGKREDLFGALLFCDDTGLHQGNVGTGFTDQELQLMTGYLDSRGHEQPNKGTFILDRPFRAIIKGMKKNKSGAIREPVFVKVLKK